MEEWYSCQEWEDLQVLILILVEVALGVSDDNVFVCVLNDVLILILVEVALGEIMKSIKDFRDNIVLILILVEVALGEKVS